MRLLVVEDDRKIASFVVNGLKQNGFETFATPVRYGSVLGTGKRSFYGDESGRLRQGNKGGREASSEDEPVD